MLAHFNPMLAHFNLMLAHFNLMLAHFNPMLAHFPSRNAFLKVSQASLLGVSGNSTMQIKMSVEYWCAAIDRGDGGSGD